MLKTMSMSRNGVSLIETNIWRFNVLINLSVITINKELRSF